MKTIEKIKPNDLISARIDAIKPLLPKNWKEILIEKYPEYNTIKGGAFINNALAKRTFDVLFTERLEEIVKSCHGKKSKQKK